ncbi:MAG: MFS transporter [archaeon]|nr:MFS transporter [archaeon]
MTIENNYRMYNKKYLFIFSFFYFVQGFIQGIPILFIPSYLTELFGNYDITIWGYIGAISTLPWIIKFIIGFANDKWGSKKYGRRFPFIFIFGLWCGIFWILMAIFLPTDQTIYGSLLFFLTMINIGIAFADTALDGMILDVTPKDKLAILQAYQIVSGFSGGAIGVLLIGRLCLITNNVPFLFIFTGLLTFICCTIPYYVKEPPLNEEAHIIQDIKRLVSKIKNYKVFLFTFLSAIANPMLVGIYTYFSLIGMGIINIEDTVLSLTTDNSPEVFLDWSVIFTMVNALGSILGGFIIGKIADKNRKKAVFYGIIPFVFLCLISNILVGPDLIGVILAFLGQFLFGVTYATLAISGGTVRGDIANNDFPDLKSTFFALTISLFNGGQTVGTLIGIFIFVSLVVYIPSFSLLYFTITVFGAVFLIISYLIFLTIDPKDYEFDEYLNEDLVN